MKELKKRITSKMTVLILVSAVIVAALTFLVQTHVIDPKYVNSTNELETIAANRALHDMEFVSVPNVTEAKTVDAPMPEIIPPGIIYPKPTNIPSLRNYEINKDLDGKIWSAQNPESYIITNDEWVIYMASQLYMEADGRIAYKNKPIPWVVTYRGNVTSWTNEHFLNNYISDDELFNFPANADLWQNADYYLSHGVKGDCEDWSIAITSMMLSGEMSIKENGSYIRQVIPAKAVIGYAGKERDIWTEYKVYGNRYISSTGKEFNPGLGKYVSITTFYHDGEWGEFVPIYQFTDKYFGKYKDDIK